jgi:Domain of unknown function (DUF5916)
MRYFLLIIFAFFLSFSTFAQSKKIGKELVATRTNAVIKIDGLIDELAWKTSPLINNFVEWRPSFGNSENFDNRTEIYMLYDDDAFYIAGYCHEKNIDSISKEFVGRDVVGVNDFVGIIFDTYNDKINGFGYYVTPLGEQFDAKYSSGDEDPSWSSVYETKAKIVKDGWVFEMKIPYAAIRFIAKNNQTWGFNITRRRNKTGQQFMWNPVDPSLGGTFLSQFGLLSNLTNIKPPVRLSFSPYISYTANHFPSKNANISNWNNTLNGGLDVKYGINQAFTLDLTLVPDFGQVQSDNQVQNLTPFEVKFNENRSFFTEGTDLFNKGNFFYSRRIGGFPFDFYNAQNSVTANDSIVKNPVETKLINATKVSGRTNGGLGVGFLNAITNTQYATILNKITNIDREVETSPLTNYNVFVLDQTLKNNSSISLINTSVIRSGRAYDATVTAFLWDMYNKKNEYNFNGKIAQSNLIGYNQNNSTLTGQLHSLNFSKIGGRFNFGIWQEFSNDKFNQNDIGYFTNNNYLDNGLWMGYRWLKPTKYFNRFRINFNSWYSMRYKNPWGFQNGGFNFNCNGQLRNLNYIGANIDYNGDENDYYEARKEGYVFKRPASSGAGIWFESNSAKKYSYGVNLFFRSARKIDAFGYDASISNSYRFNNKLTISLFSSIEKRNNNYGYATQTSNFVILGLRDRITFENILNIKYNFSNVMGLNVRVRHYNSSVDYNKYLELYENGTIVAAKNQYNRNSNYNFLNVDMNYTWQFALGSFINFNWKLAAENTNIIDGYFSNLSKTLSSDQNNNLSIKIIYFLDYLSIHKRKKN